MKICAKCHKEIDEFNEEAKWSMIITKKGQKIIEFKCFHIDCWKEHVEKSIGLGVMKEIENNN
tara:strand:- start:37 stop:225 length:189 start_codon:yes stop_codon:yes gene_type:complete